ncbi:MAG: helix-turn-helix domain-containing protein [Rhodobacteraceae bacterium]|nr:helix-turn-helix domain-containing protein [Paracoccaceae bacterium]
MGKIRFRADPNDPSTFPRGTIDYARVDATTEEDIARHKREDEAEALQEMADDIRQLRKRMHLSQREFARRLRILPDTVRNWEQGKRFPSGPACALLRVLIREPETVMHALA